MKRGRLNPVSPDRDRKREASGVRGPLCRYVVRERCAACGGFPTDPAHLERVGKGHGDWKRVGGIWMGRVAPLCRSCHRRFDGNEVGWVPFPGEVVERIHADASRLGRAWAVEFRVVLMSETHPYDQWREMGSPEFGDLPF